MPQIPDNAALQTAEDLLARARKTDIRAEAVTLIAAAVAILGPISVASAPPKAGLCKAGVVALIDETGSMKGVAVETISGYNAFIKKLQNDLVDTKNFFSLYLFDSACNEPILRPLAEGADIASATPLSEANYRPRGMTPLYDAIGEMITRVDPLFEKNPGVRLTVVIQTDGAENASRIYNVHQIRQMIENRKLLGWQFVFLGADLTSAYDIARNIGVPVGNTAYYSKALTGQSLDTVAANVGAYASSSAESVAFTARQKKEMGEDQKQ